MSKKLQAELTELRALVAVWKEAFGTPELFTNGRDQDLQQAREDLVKAHKEIHILTQALTDGMCVLKLARRIHRDLAHCIDQLPHNQQGTIDLYRERLEGYGPFLGRTSNYRVFLTKKRKPEDE